VVGQDTEKTGMLPLMSSPVDQEVPFHMAASEPTAIQNDGDTHDTETTETLMVCGDDQVEPFQVTKSLGLPRAMQNDDDVHDTEVRLFPMPFTELGEDDQEVPFQEKALPSESTPIQKDGDGQDIERIPSIGSMLCGVDQV
jgi:hypothetical protein